MLYNKRIIFIIIAFLSLNSVVFSQSISFKINNITVREAISELKKQTGYSFVYSVDDLSTQKLISVSVQNEKIDEAVEQILIGQDLSYEIQGKNIIIKKNNTISDPNKKLKKVTGIITDDNDSSLPGANIVVKETLNIVVADLDGHFSLDVPEDATLIISFIGFDTQTLSLKDSTSTSLKIRLYPNSNSLHEVVVIGYTSQKKALLTGSVVSMNLTDDKRLLPFTSAGTLLVGEMSGVNVSTPNGVPGATPRISIRTNSSFNNQPVTYVIDGIVKNETDFNRMSPNEIENITVLKDAASAAIYGSRSAGGVMLVTTRRGKIGKPIFNYSFSSTIETRTKNVSLTDAVQTGEIYNRVQGLGGDWAWSQQELDYYKNVNGGWGYDQLSSVWQNPTTMIHNLSVSGGSEKVRYFAGTSYVKQEGFLAPLSYDKYNFRLNLTVDVTKNFEIFAAMTLNTNLQSNHIWSDLGYYTKLLVWQPDQPVFTDTDKKPIDYSFSTNVGATVRGEGGYNKTQNLNPQAILNFTYKFPFLQGLSTKGAFSQSWTNDVYSGFYKNYPMYTVQREGIHGHIYHTDDASILSTRMSTWYSKDFIEKEAKWGQSYQANFQLNYDHSFNKHQVQGVLVYEKMESDGESVYGGRETFPVYLTDQFWAASDARSDSYAGGDPYVKNGRISYIGQFSYSYADKYLFNFSFREDGSMNFAPDQRWGFFPAAKAGWVISEEPFFYKGIVQNLKLSASVGLTGNDAVGGWQWQESYRSANPTYLGTIPTKEVGITYGPLVNPDLTWEKDLSYNFAVDVVFFKHWSTTIDYWFRKSHDLLGNRIASVPVSFSLSLPSENYGQINAQGIDFNLGYMNNTGAFGYYTNLTMSYGWNKVIIKDYEQNAKPIDIPVGKSTNYIKGYVFDQIIRTQAQLDQFNIDHPDYKIAGVSPALGMMVYKDFSGPLGKPDNIIDSWDQKVLKPNNFPIVYGLKLGCSWKDFSVETMFSGKIKEEKSFKGLADGVEWNRMWSEWYGNSWTPENPDAWLPRRVNTTKTYQQDSNFWYKDASFVRLKYINIGYSIPKRIFNNAIEKFRVYCVGTNLFVASKFNYYDPEIGNGTDFPIMRTFNIGIDVAF